MKENNITRRLLALTALATEYCQACENCGEADKMEFVDKMLGLLPRIYWEFFDISADDTVVLEEWDNWPEYIDEEFYEELRLRMARVLGEDDIFLETFEEDMKYSDTPIAASASEALADIFQPLYNFICTVKDTDGDRLADAFIHCKEYFEEYWSQTLCNVMRALNNIKYPR